VSDKNVEGRRRTEWGLKNKKGESAAQEKRRNLLLHGFCFHYDLQSTLFCLFVACYLAARKYLVIEIFIWLFVPLPEIVMYTG